MKRFLLIWLCLCSCLFFRPEAGHATRRNTLPVNGSNKPYSAGVPEAEVTKAGISKAGAKQRNERPVYQAAGPKGSVSPQGFMDAEFLALLLLIMVLGMLYTNPSR